MNPGTFYLYEYENGRRTRNIGFIKVSRHYRSCILQLHARGVPVGNGASVQLWAFFRDDGGSLIAEQIAVLNCFGRSISARLPVSETRFPDGRPLSQIDGFIVKLPGRNPAMFWMASAFFFDVDIQRMKTASSIPKTQTAEAIAAETANAETDDAEPRATEAVRTEPDVVEAVTAEPNTDEADHAEPVVTESDSAHVTAEADHDRAGVTKSSDTELDAAVSADAGPGITEPDSAHAAAEADHDEAGVSKSSGTEPDVTETDNAALSEAAASSAQPAARKIQRADMSQLPRRFWPLANNSFLLHGYHNYGHLMLIEEDGRLWLGVPGTYAPQEARAADLFGFPRFTRSYAESPELTAEERTDDADFGHWCRCVGSIPPR
ncbi:MAG TPA: hypothetical protein H9780_03805 [Candidatus Mediterraneibacter merdavium]|nr:hypothetical protein [Candidatus Mediterraneibacter merdavium]